MTFKDMYNNLRKGNYDPKPTAEQAWLRVEKDLQEVSQLGDNELGKLVEDALKIIEETKVPTGPERSGRVKFLIKYIEDSIKHE